MDNVIIAQHGDVLNSSMLQFGFKQKHSTVQCSFVIQEVLDYYTRDGSQCHVIMLDASKAFDRVRYSKLFEVLLRRRMCPLVAAPNVH